MRILILIVAALVIIACNKEKTITKARGIVVNSGTGRPIEGVKVVMQDGISGSSSPVMGDGNTTGSKKTVEYITKADGMFSLELEGEAPFIWAEKDSYRFVNLKGAYEISSLQAGSDNNLKLNMDANSYFNPIYKGMNCINSDTICYGEDKSIPSLYLLRNNVKGFGNGPHGGGGKGLLARGDHYYPFWIKYQIQGIWHERIDSVYISSFTTYTDTIYY